jgi:hypothetical protein
MTMAPSLRRSSNTDQVIVALHSIVGWHHTARACSERLHNGVGQYLESQPGVAASGVDPESDARVPLVTTIFPIPALTVCDGFKRLNQLDTHDVFGHLVAELPLDANSQWRTICNG